MPEAIGFLFNAAEMANAPASRVLWHLDYPVVAAPAFANRLFGRSLKFVPHHASPILHR